MTQTTKPFYAEPILNSPYAEPTRHHALSDRGEPLDHPPILGRRRSSYISPVPRGRRQIAEEDNLPGLGLGRNEDDRYDQTPIINEIRSHVAAWRSLPNPGDWGVTLVTQKLLQHWREHEFTGPRPFFCQIEAVETVIWLTEVAPRRKQHAAILKHLEDANRDANPEIFRIALKLATGAGKTTVMAMLIAWQAINSVRQPHSRMFSRGFLLIAPGITIKDRLQVLDPANPESYYRSREILPPEMLPDLGKAKVQIVNYHAFRKQKAHGLNSVGLRVIKGWKNEPIEEEESEGAMLLRVCPDLLKLKNIVVINDEAHHCYRERPGEPDEAPLRGEDREEAEERKIAARLWISGIEALKRKAGLRAVYDLSATPFFLRGSGYEEGRLFPWVVSDFSLIDAIESGIVKLPRVPVADNAVNDDSLVYRNLWDEIGREMPKKGAAKAGPLPARSLPPKLETALKTLYTHYAREFEAWQKAGFDTPPVFIVVCNNTASSKLIFDWIAGWQRTEEGEVVDGDAGNLALFQNFDRYRQPTGRMNTILIDSRQLESGEALDPQFRELAAREIEQFRDEIRRKEGAQAASKVSDAELLREVMNTVGQKGKLGEQVRCVVSVSMLTEGWDAQTVTHILGVRAFGTQLLCEQVVGRALRRRSYEADENGMFAVEYADIMGIPFDFATEAQVVARVEPRPTTRIHAMRERAHLSIRFPRISGYRTELPPDRFHAKFEADSILTLTPEEVGPCRVRMEGLVGEGHDLSPDILEETRPHTIAFHLTRHLIAKHFNEPGERPPYMLFNQLQPFTKYWVHHCLRLTGGTKAGMVLYDELKAFAAQKIFNALVRGVDPQDQQPVRALLDPYNPHGYSDHVGFITSKQLLYRTERSHVNLVVCDSDWEAEFARVVESHPQTIAYVKNQALGFEVPYRFGSVSRRYLPDFLVLVDDGKGADDPLNLVIEIKGYRGIDAQLKAEAMETHWVPAVNRLKTYGRWAFGEFRSAFQMEADYADFVRAHGGVRA